MSAFRVLLCLISSGMTAAAGMDDFQTATLENSIISKLPSLESITQLVMESENLDEVLKARSNDISSFVSALKISMPLGNIMKPEDDVEGRARMKKILIPVILAMTIMAAIVIPALMTVIKLIAVKGLWSGVVSLIIAKLLGLKSLLSHHHHHDNHHGEEGRRPYLIYVPPGKHRRDEADSTFNEKQTAWEQIRDVQNIDYWKRATERVQA